MIDALISGRLLGQPVSRTARNGSPFATAKVRVATGNGEAQFVNVITFSRTTITALLALQDGDSVALAGELTIGTYQAKDGTTRPSLDLTAHAVLTEYHVQRKRKAVREPEPATAQPPDAGTPPRPAAVDAAADDGFDDEIPF